MPFPAFTVELDIGDLRRVKTGKRYDNVFPVPVGDIAAKSRDCDHQVDVVSYNRTTHL